MTHTSWINERGDEGRDNERLEYLGDAVLELVAAEYLFNRFPSYDEGQLTQMRSSLVSTVALAGIGEQLRLGEALRLGRGATKSGARRLTSLHANAFEAIIGATFLDQGYRKAGKIFLSRIGDLSSWTDPNFKGRLQALAQERYGMPPLYRTLPEGNARPRQYLSQVSVEGGPVLGEGRGGTKQAAEQGAARAAIDHMVAPASRKRRRGGRTGVGAADTPSPRPMGEANREPEPNPTPVLEAIPPSVAEVADPPAPPARKRRRRSRGTGGGAAPAAAGEAPSAAGEATPLPPAAPATVPEAVPAGSDPPAPKRRRRRSRGGGSASADPSRGGATTSAAPAAPEEVPTAGPQPAPARRRRRRPRGGASPSPVPEAVSQPDPSEPVADERPLPSTADEGGSDGAPRRRSHRGRRGGRGRSGRPATPVP